MSELPREPSYFVDRLTTLQLSMRDALMTRRREASEAAMRSAEGTGESDIIYSPDAWVHDVLIDFCHEWAEEIPFLLVAEDIEGGSIVFPKGTPEDDSQFVLIVDPVDGTRGLMYDKRSAWVLSGVASYRGPETNLRDIEVAVQTEIPTSRQYLSAMVYGIMGAGVWGEQHNIFSNEVTPFSPQPATNESIAHGFATIAKFFPSGKSLAAAIEERLMETISSEAGEEFPMIFDDQYISSGGQLYELMVGHDLFTADLRPLLLAQAGAGSRLGKICAHPYDLCTELIAREAGVIVTDLDGRALSAPLDTTTNILWLGFANEGIQRQVYPVLKDILRDLGLI